MVLMATLPLAIYIAVIYLMSVTYCKRKHNFRKWNFGRICFQAEPNNIWCFEV